MGEHRISSGMEKPALFLTYAFLASFTKHSASWAMEKGWKPKGPVTCP